jgi:membrane-bound lytic murein transglycosylase A
VLILLAQASPARTMDDGWDAPDPIPSPSEIAFDAEFDGLPAPEPRDRADADEAGGEAVAPRPVLKYVDPGPEIRREAPVSAASSETPPTAAARPPHKPTAPRGSERFATRHAHYVPASWDQIPGWREGATLHAWSAFAHSCTVLVHRPAWRQTCERAWARRPATAAAVREFFEREFEAFQIRSVDLADTGILTGYFEASLEGSRVRTDRFRHPVYGVPDDLLFLDARLLSRRQPPVHVRVEGRDVVPAEEGSGRVYRLAVARVPGSVRDGKVRVRRSGDRIVPYFTRQEIERGGLGSAEALAWVDDAHLLYTLHIEGSGRIKLADGQVVRVAFGEQNGHPFRPTVSVEPLPLAPGRSEMARLADFLVPPAAAASEGATAEGPRVSVSSARDPSYVFFRRIPNTDSGPPGAMGVPLTAGASLAVDPRVTPLGAPVFIAARPPGAASAMRRLMVAQDTGGAIRGAVRADYFLGFGHAAGAIAMRMKDELQMWVLLPKQLAIASQHALAHARGGSWRARCLLPDPEFCAD